MQKYSSDNHQLATGSLIVDFVPVYLQKSIPPSSLHFTYVIDGVTDYLAPKNFSVVIDAVRANTIT
jgi:hypothetical protein